MKRDNEEAEDSNKNLTYQIARGRREISLLMDLPQANTEKLENTLKYKTDACRLEHEVQQMQDQYVRLSQQFEETVEELELDEKRKKIEIFMYYYVLEM